jgi:hypothetical protein
LILKENKSEENYPVPKSLKSGENPGGTKQRKNILRPNASKAGKIQGEQTKKKPLCAQRFKERHRADLVMQ